MLPWCKAMAPDSSGATFNRAWYHLSVMPRVLMKIRVVLLLLMMGITFSTSFNPRCPAHGYFSISSGMMDSISIFLLTIAFIIFPAGSPLPFKEANSTSFACSRLPMVADIPQIDNLSIAVVGFWLGATATSFVFRQPIILAMASSTCTPLLLPSNSCHSSTARIFKLSKTSR